MWRKSTLLRMERCSPSGTWCKQAHVQSSNKPRGRQLSEHMRQCYYFNVGIPSVRRGCIKEVSIRNRAAFPMIPGGQRLFDGSWPPPRLPATPRHHAQSIIPSIHRGERASGVGVTRAHSVLIDNMVKSKRDRERANVVSE